MNLTELVELGAKPIRAEEPSGKSARDEPEFETLQLEVRKLELPDGLQPDWDIVIEKSTAILREKSKDLLPACYLCVGLLQRQGYPGLAAGLALLGDLVEGHWEGVFPELKRMRGRVAAFEWLAERGARVVSARRPTPDQAEALASCQEKTIRLGTLLDEKIESSFNLLAELRRALDEAAVAMRQDAPSTSTTAPSAAPDSGARFPAEIKTVEDATRALTEMRELGKQIAACLQVAEPANPVGYRLPRVLSWIHLAALPPNTDGQTQIPPPQPPDFAQKIQDMVNLGQWAGVLEQVEGRFASAILWLDLHRYCVTALEGLGHQSAADAVCDELNLLLKRLPGLESLRFAGGQGLADSATRSWIQKRVRSGDGDAGASGLSGSSLLSGDPGTDGDFAVFEEVRPKALELARRKQLPEAIRLLEDGAGTARSLRVRAAFKLEIGRMLQNEGHAETALARLHQLDQELQQATCEEWDPGLCLEVAKSLFLCHQKVLSSLRPPPSEELARSRELLGRLSRLDVLSALTLGGKR